MDKTLFSPSAPSNLHRRESLETVRWSRRRKSIRWLQKLLKQEEYNIHLARVSCPLFVTKRSGFNDNLNGIECPGTFAPRDFQILNQKYHHSHQRNGNVGHYIIIKSQLDTESLQIFVVYDVMMILTLHILYVRYSFFVMERERKKFFCLCS